MRRRTALLGVAAAAGIVWLGGRNTGIRDADAVGQLYDRVSGVYDVLTAPYEWIDGRRLQRKAINELGLHPGDTVVDLGTGTGWNLPHLAEAVGPEGRVVGVDLSHGMLTRARRRVDRAGHRNIELVRADLRDYDPPADTAAVIGTFALEMVPDYDDVIRRLAGHLNPGSKIALVGMREPDGWPEWVIRLGSLANRPLGVNPAYRNITPWTSIHQQLTDATTLTSHGGVVYMAVGTVSQSTSA